MPFRQPWHGILAKIGKSVLIGSFAAVAIGMFGVFTHVLEKKVKSSMPSSIFQTYDST